VVDCDNCGVGEVTDPVEEFESLYVVLGDEQLDERIDKLINKIKVIFFIYSLFKSKSY
jgi:hypothetical protein